MAGGEGLAGRSADAPGGRPGEEDATASAPADDGAGDLYAVVLRQELQDARVELEEAEARERRHWTVAVFGASPSVIVVALGLLATGSRIALVVFCFVVALVEGWRAVRAGNEARRLEERLAEILAELEEKPEYPSSGRADGAGSGS
mgnify:CR=1 FL=1